jgi:sucrose-6-phosphate hydrolase SacC (GH32 family)
MPKILSPTALVLLFVLSAFCSIGGAKAPATENAYKATADASSVYNSGFPAEYAVDGDRNTRWCSSRPYGKQEWLQIDLGKVQPIGRIELHWEIAFGLGYQLSVSNDAKDWKEVFRSGKGNGDRDVLNSLKASGRYLKLDCLERGTEHGFSIWEVNVYPEPTSRTDDIVPHEPTYKSRVPAIQSTEFVADNKYLLIPVSNGKGLRSKLWLMIDDLELGPYDVTMPRSADDVDWTGHFPLTSFEGKRVKVRVNDATEEVFGLVRQSDTIPGGEDFYEEELRPQFHFSARTGWLNDPNGLIYYKGEYHMYFQHNPLSVRWGNMSWGHAVSKDMIHWEEKPAVLFPNAQGTCYSGAAFIDRRNQLGLKTGAEDVIVAFYLRTGTGLAYAYSNDSGYSFTEYEANPVLTRAGARIDTPRPLWYEPTKRWVCPTYDFFTNDQGKRLRCVGFYSSEDLKTWKFESRVEQDKWGDELCGCVDFFEFPVDGDPKNKKWVMILIDGSYIIGTFDGHTFFNQDGKPAITRDRIDSLVVDHNYYATMTWHNMPNDRRVQITWMRSGHHFPGTPYGQQMTLPSELTLHSTDEGLRLRMNPIEEFNSLRTRTHEFDNVVLKQNENPLAAIQGELFDLEAEFVPTPGSATTFDMRGIPVRYVADTQMLSCGPVKTKLATIDGKIGLRIIQDRTCIEVYGNDGRVYIPVIQTPEEGNTCLKASCDKGEVKASYLRVRELKSAWDE